MKLIEPSVELIEQEPGIEGIYKQIERCARVCYKSEDKITEDSARKFVDMLIKNGHGAMLEHGTVYMEVPIEHWREDEHEWVYMFPDRCPWISLDCDGDWMYITTNFRHILNGDVGETLMKQYMCEPTENHEKRYTLKFTTSIGITRELTRHRHMSFACESTRYCNYSKDKFGGEITFVKPTWVNIPSELPEGTKLEDGPYGWCNSNYIHIYCKDIKSKWFMKACLEAEYSYLHVINEQNATPQEAREILPLCTKSEIIMTGFESDWKHFFKLRCDKAAHPDMQMIANKARELLKL
jgi:thymidylate synthase (FAD)